jgi:5-methyltetrahydropteroyltriglutamate--homocysteine methyltransferase
MAKKIKSTVPPRSIPRADVIGSLLRPQVLKDLIDEVYEPRHTALLQEERDKDRSRLRELEDQVIADLVQRQIDAGLDVVSDGEMRRYMFVNSFYDAVDGLSPSANDIVFFDKSGDEITFPGPASITGKLKKVDSPAAREAAYLKSITDFPFKVSFPAGSWWCFPPNTESGHGKAYESGAELTKDAVAITQELVKETVAAGANYVQFDFPQYPLLVDGRMAGFIPDLDGAIAGALDADTAVLEGIPSGVRKALHLCRGNMKGHRLAQGPLDPVAERLFSLPYDSFLIEWDDKSYAGGFEALRYVPKGGPIVVLGLVSTKLDVVESEDSLLALIDEASQHLDVDQLAISTQCGFASEMAGNPIAEESQWRKLETVAKVADRVWPRS